MLEEQKAEPREEDKVPVVSLVGIFFKAKQLEKQGKDVIHFDAGEPDYEPPKEVVEATVQAVRSGKGRYTEPGGVPEVKKAISEHLNDKYALTLSPKQTMMTAGGRLALYYAFCALPKNAKIGMISPDWPAYRDLAQFMGLKPVFFPTRLENSWDLDLDAIRASKCNAIVLNTPNNPTGKILDPKTFEKLIDVARSNEMTIIGDEVYSDYILNEEARFKSLLQVKDCKWIYATSLSKSYSMTGFRAGYVVADEATISKLESLNSMLMTSAPEFVQYAAIAALQCKDYVREKVQLIKKRRDTAVASLRKSLDAQFYVPDGALYVFPRLHNLGKSQSVEQFDSEQFALKLLNEAYVSVTPGTSFGSWYKEFVRITLLQSEHRIQEGIERMAKVLS